MWGKGTLWSALSLEILSLACPCICGHKQQGYTAYVESMIWRTLPRRTLGPYHSLPWMRGRSLKPKPSPYKPLINPHQGIRRLDLLQPALDGKGLKSRLGIRFCREGHAGGGGGEGRGGGLERVCIPISG